MKTLLLKDEAARLEVLRQYQILDTEPEEAFDDLAKLAAQICGTPIALINIIDTSRQWFKAKVGLDVSQMPRNIGFGSLCMEQGEVLIIPDTLADKRYANNTVVKSFPHVRFYGGIPLITSEGQAIGTLCVLDRVPHQIKAEQVEALIALSRQVVRQLELRRNLTELASITSEYKQALESLRKSAAENLLLARAVNSVSDGVVITDPTQPGNPIIYINAAFSRITGYEPEEVIGRNCQFLRGIDTDPSTIAEINQGIAQGRDVQVTILNYRKDGQPFWNELKISPVFSDEGDLINFVATQTDITDRKQAQEALRHSESTLRSFFDTAPMMMGVVELKDDDILLVSDNAATAKFFGLSPKVMQNCLLGEVGVPKNYLREWIHYYREAERTQSPVQFESLWDTCAGKKWLKATVCPIALSSSNRSRFAYVVEDISDRKQTEQERLQLLQREQAARNRTINILESITDGFFALDQDWNFTYLNEQAEPLLQRKRAELLGKNIWDEFPEAVGSKFYNEYYKAVTEQISVEFEDFYLPLNTWFEVHAYPSKHGLSVYFQDITKRKLAEQELRWQEALLRSMTSVSTLAFYVVDNGTDKILYFNDRFCEIWGIEHLKEQMARGELKNQDIIPDCLKFISNIPAFIASCKPLQSKEKHCNFEDEIPFTDGRTIRRFSTQIHDEDERYFGRLYIFEDITERKLTEHKIREQAALLDVATDAILVRDLTNEVLYWNKSAETLYGWKAEEALGKNANQLLYRKILPPTPKIEKTVLQSGSWQGELRKVKKSGKEVIVESRWTLVRDEQGNPKAILTVDTDITQKKQLEAQLLRAQRMESIGTLASGIAHDLNNVLAPILMSAQLLKMKTTDERSQQILTLMESNAKRGGNLVKQVLSFARGIEGDYYAHGTERTVLQVKQLITEIKQIVKETFPKSIDIYTDLSKNLWCVRGDATQLHQVLINLCVNARDAMPNGGNLKISATNIVIDENFAQMQLDASVGDYIIITLSDSGLGMTSEVIDRIFEPFFTTKELGKGTGLGLSTVMAIVKSHGGFITVASEIGKGTEFKVYLPAVKASQTQPLEDTEMPLGKGELILVVDDEAPIREITKTTLESHNYKVMSASDGIEAIAVCAQHKDKISLAIVDMMMPNMDGATTIRALHKMNPKIKIIPVSGLAANDKLAIVTQARSKVFLYKPYTASELLKTIKTVISQ